MDILRAYRGWMWKRLALLLPAQGAALLVTLRLAADGSVSASIRISCVTLAALLSLLIAYFLLQTFRAAAMHRRSGGREAREVRRHLKPHGPFAALSLLLLIALLLIPHLLTEPALAPPLPLARRRAASRAPQPPAIPLGKWILEEAVPVAKEPSPPERAAGIPEVVPVLAPPRIELTDRDFEIPTELAVPYVPRQNADPSVPGQSEKDPLALRPDLIDLRGITPPQESILLLTRRPLPDESDPDGWPSPEFRLEGMLLIGRDGARIPAFNLVMDIPFGRNDSFQASWIAAMLPPSPEEAPTRTPDWHQLTLAYQRRLTGYTSLAPFDLAVSAGISLDVLGPMQGIPDPGGIKLAPYLGVEAAFWQYGVLGLLLHASESFPILLGGSTLGVTDLGAQLRLDLTDRISIQGGYRVLLLRYNYDDASKNPGFALLREKLSGPTFGVDLRF